MTNKKIDYTTRPATNLDYRYCYKLTKQNMFDLFCRHWGGWVSSAFRDDFNVDATTMILCGKRRIGYYSLKDEEEGLYLDNLQLSPLVQGKGIGTDILKTILHCNKYKQIRLTTFSDNQAFYLYQKLGFVVTGSDGAMVYMKKCPIK